MKATLEQLLRLPVETERGLKLGQVSSLILDIDAHTILHYVIRSSYLPRPFANELLIAPSQVVGITKKKMVVVDSALPDGAAVPTPS